MCENAALEAFSMWESFLIFRREQNIRMWYPTDAFHSARFRHKSFVDTHFVHYLAL